MIYVSLCGHIKFTMPTWFTEEERVKALQHGRLVRIAHNRAFPECDGREHLDPVWLAKRTLGA